MSLPIYVLAKWLMKELGLYRVITLNPNGLSRAFQGEHAFPTLFFRENGKRDIDSFAGIGGKLELLIFRILLTLWVHV